MSLSFYIKPKKKFFLMTEILSVKQALELSSQRLTQYSFDEDSGDWLNAPLNTLEGIQLGVEGKCARGFNLSYEPEHTNYRVHINTPSSIQDWQCALAYVKDLAQHCSSQIISEHEDVFTTDNISDFDYMSDIKAGIDSLTQIMSESDMKVLTQFGLNRPFNINQHMVDDIVNSSNPAYTFSEMFTNVQNEDIFTASQMLYENTEEGFIFATYVLSQGVRTALPHTPSVNYEHADQVKNEDIKEWWLSIVGETTEGSDEMEFLGRVKYADFIKHMEEQPLTWLDAQDIIIEPFDYKAIQALLDLGEREA